MEEKLFAGYHKIKVTPPLGLPVPGYFAQRTSDGIISDLYLRCTAFALGEKNALVFSLDALSLNAQAFEIVSDMITRATGVETDGIYITCGHSHTAFRVIKPSEEWTDTDIFLRWLFQQFPTCAKLALEDLKPCTVKTARGSAKGVGFVRVYRMKDGSVRTNPGFGNPDIVEPLSKQDDQVQLIRVLREGGSEILMVNFGTHADTVGGSKYCADWPGYLCDTLENAFDGQADAMTLVGAQGNSNHMDFIMPQGTPYKSLELYTKRMARVLAGEVLKIYDSAAECEPALSYGSRIAKVGKNAYDPATVPMARELVDLYKKYGNYNEPIFATYPMKVPEANRIINNLSRPEFFELRVSGLNLAGIGLIGIPGEPFVSIGMDIKEGSPMEHTWVTCQTNGSQGYYPDALAFAQKDGYERTSSPFAADCGKVLTEEALALLNELN